MSSSQERLESPAAPSEHPTRPLDRSHRAREVRLFHVGDRLPQAISRAELAAFLGVSLRQFDAIRQKRAHPAVKELLPRIGAPRFSGAVAQAWAEGARTVSAKGRR